MQILLGLGGNQGDVAATLSHAQETLAARFSVIGASGLWRTKAIGPPQDDFLNTCLLIDSQAHPLQVLAHCLRIETECGRDRSREVRWGPRSLDIDLLIAPDVVVTSPGLTLPHANLHERRFALLPACELVPDWIHPRLRLSLRELLALLVPDTQPCEIQG